MKTDELLTEHAQSIRELREQVVCGVSGHRFTMVSRGEWEHSDCYFRCLDCRLEYSKPFSQLSVKEKKATDSTFS